MIPRLNAENVGVFAPYIGLTYDETQSTLTDKPKLLSEFYGR
jgi:hypothetical protein